MGIDLSDMTRTGTGGFITDIYAHNSAYAYGADPAYPGKLSCGTIERVYGTYG